jgi:hypothetical protein
MRLEVETTHDAGRELPLAFRLRGRCIAVVDIIDQWFGPTIATASSRETMAPSTSLRVVEHCSDWQLARFASPRIAAALSGI